VRLDPALLAERVPLSGNHSLRKGSGYMPIEIRGPATVRQKRMMELVKVAAVCLCLMGASPAGAQPTGDARQGLIYAQQNCSDCHAIIGGRRAGIATFKEIANTPGMTRTALIVWFQTPHPNMPNLILAPSDRDDIIAYILSLRDTK
jgi:mono/diheme cytochrome c family protein